MIIFEASFTGVLNTLFTLALFYYGFKLFTKYVLPFLLKRWVNKKMGQFQNHGQDQYQEQQKERESYQQHEGEVKIQSRGSKTKSETKDLGDFVDYEEVE